MNRNLSVINACIIFLQNLWLPQYYYTYLGFSNRSLIDYLNALKFILLFCIFQKERSRKLNLNLQQPKQVIPGDSCPRTTHQTDIYIYIPAVPNIHSFQCYELIHCKSQKVVSLWKCFALFHVYRFRS